MPGEGEIDILDASGPCQPFSAMRNSGFSKPAEQHDLYGVTFADAGSIISACKLLKPMIFMSEQVIGFGKSEKDNKMSSPKSDFIAEVMSIPGEEGLAHFKHCISITLDAKSFINTDRPRFLGRLPHFLDLHRYEYPGALDLPFGWADIKLDTKTSKLIK
jgi:hypothetical protein